MIRDRLHLYLEELPNALMLATTTAVMTLILAVILSMVLGTENVRHREASRCQAALIVNMLRDAYELNPVYESIRRAYPEINLEGLDCTPYLVEPLEPDTP